MNLNIKDPKIGLTYEEITGGNWYIAVHREEGYKILCYVYLQEDDTRDLLLIGSTLEIEHRWHYRDYIFFPAEVTIDAEVKR